MVSCDFEDIEAAIGRAVMPSVQDTAVKILNRSKIPIVDATLPNILINIFSAGLEPNQERWMMEWVVERPTPDAARRAITAHMLTFSGWRDLLTAVHEEGPRQRLVSGRSNAKKNNRRLAFRRKQGL
ncbi:hypothetical protein J8273_6610 [Carpediemonas membranifera]|uniref:Uncharacterized protein n=1 Tax=Carpediemonas membranifera TaxID=201153 RepID=A0A8J6DYC9_9EUKA|nr:hypothetical protein J8273_6610 [Carpediemonas membranifera]|eukprot:KAG9392019.1 hypothetical protein J8273_6610 [Carpediemonas membranifera]